ncbi:hypothetical protein U1Q18_005419 [Sarracenia purpurea var. burkii]
MSVEGIPFLIDYIKEEPHMASKAILEERFAKISSKDDKNCISVKKAPEDATNEMAGDQSTEQTTKPKKSKTRLDSSKNPNTVELKTVKIKKTKFEQYLELEMKEGLSAKADLCLERQLAKKLKVIEGKLLGDDDGIGLLVEGIPSALDSFENEKDIGDESSRKSSKNCFSLRKCIKLKKSDREPEVEMVGDTAVVKSEPVETFRDEMGCEKVLAQISELVGNKNYVNSHRGSLLQTKSEECFQIRRRVRGLLNKLVESNIESIAGEIAPVFRSIARGDGSEIIIEEVLASFSEGPLVKEKYAAFFAAFVAGIASMVGIDFGAKLLASLAKCFEDEYLEENNHSLQNLTLLLSNLYVFGVCSSDLIYDLMIMLSKRLMEIDVSTILTILRCCGMNLRGDDPAAMKQFVLSVQNKANELKASTGNGGPNTSSKRMEFMLETICDIKNNKKRAKEDTPQLTRIQKWLHKLRVEDILIRGLKWSRLLDPGKKGQWWLPGDVVSITSNVEEVVRATVKESLESQKLLQLAGAQRMNTDVRRAIFCLIMSGEDYIDAFEKLLRLNLQGKQDREIMRVLVDCCLQEQVFNKYYSVVAMKLCSHDKNHKITLEYCIWDHYKGLESMQLLRSRNLSKFVSDMIVSFTLSLAMLKCVDFSGMVPKQIIHFKMLFETIFEQTDKLVWNIFTRLAVGPEYESLRNSIVFFIHKHVVVSGEKSLANKIKIANKALANVEGILI